MLNPLITCKSHYTFLEGVHSIADLVNFATGKGAGTLCLTDKNGLYGAVEFYLLCREADIHPLIGTELVQGERHITVVARNMKGYEELSEWVTRFHLGSLCIQDDLFPDSPNLLYLCCDNFLLQRWFAKTLTPSRTGPKTGRSGLTNNLFLALPLSNRRLFRSVLNLVSHRSELPRVPAVPIVQLNLLYPSDESLYKVLRAIHRNCTVDTLPGEEGSTWTVCADDIQPGSIPYEPIIPGAEIAKLCHLELNLQHYHLPKFTPVT